MPLPPSLARTIIAAWFGSAFLASLPLTRPCQLRCPPAADQNWVSWGAAQTPPMTVQQILAQPNFVAQVRGSGGGGCAVLEGPARVRFAGLRLLVFWQSRSARCSPATPSTATQPLDLHRHPNARF